MRWTYASSRPALILRRHLGRLGVGVPQVAVRARVPWHVWVAGLILVIAVVAAGVFWAVREGWLTERGDPPAELERLRARTAELERELAELRAIDRANGGTTLRVERVVQEQLARQLKSLEAENARLKEDLSFFENLATKGGSGFSISRLQVEPDSVPGQYRYRLLAVLQGGRKDDREFIGSLQLIVTYLRQGERASMILPDPRGADADQYAVRFRHFRRLDGSFRLPQGSKPARVEARLLRNGAAQASQSVDF